MLKKILDFYKISQPTEPLNLNEAQQQKLYKRLRLSSFISATLGYSLYYVCRTTLNIVKEPILKDNVLDAIQLGVIGSVLLFSYAIGKFVNSFLADHSNIKRFMATGLIVSAVVNVIIGVLGLMQKTELAMTNAIFFLCFAIAWGINGWSQSMGAAPAIISLSRWYPLKERGSFYGFFSASHNIGEFVSFILVGGIVASFGWQWGFIGASIAGAIGILIILFFLHDTPQSKGLPSVEILTNEIIETKTEDNTKKTNTVAVQKAVIKNPLVWILALASAFMYITRYAVNGWGVLFLQNARGFTLLESTQIISINALLGVLGTIFSGWISDKLFKGNRYFPAFLFGLLNTLSLVLFLFFSKSIFMNMLSMVLFGTAIGVLICFLGGLMAIDIVPRNATGAALGIVGIASYAGAGLQDIFSGYIIERNRIKDIAGISTYDFTGVSIFWIISSIISFLLVLLVWWLSSKKRNKQ